MSKIQGFGQLPVGSTLEQHTVSHPRAPLATVWCGVVPASTSGEDERQNTLLLSELTCQATQLELERHEMLVAWDKDKAELLFGWESDRRRLALLLQQPAQCSSDIFETESIETVRTRASKQQGAVDRPASASSVDPAEYLERYPPMSSEPTGASHEEQCRAFRLWLQQRLRCIREGLLSPEEERLLVDNRLSALARLRNVCQVHHKVGKSLLHLS